MATRFYASSIDVPKYLGSAITPAFDTNWTSTNNMSRFSLALAHTGSGLTTLQRSKSDSTRRNLGLIQLVSPPLVAGIEITSTDTVRTIFQASENATTADCSSKMSIRVFNQDGTALRTTLLALDTSTTNIIEWSTTPSSKLFPRMNDADPLPTLADYTTQDGDRIVCELGFLTANTNFATSQGRITIGDPTNATDYNFANNETGANTGWIEFSVDLSFKPNINPRRQRMQIMGIGSRRMAETSVLPKELIPTTSANVNSFLDSMAVGSHDYGAPNIYSNHSAIITANTAIGIPLSRGNPLAVMNALPSGWKTSMLFSLPRTTDTAEITTSVNADLDIFATYYDADRLSHIEMPNEPDLFTKFPNSNNIDPAWPQYLGAFYKIAYPLAKSRFPDIPVIGSSLGHNKEADVNSILAEFSGGETPGDYCDEGCLHSYPGPVQPHTGLDQILQISERLYPGKELNISESGYHTAINAWQIGAGGEVSEAAQAWYEPKMYLEYFKKGIKTLWMYELLDRRPNAETTSFNTPVSPSNSINEGNFGFYRGNNNASAPDITGPKPVVNNFVYLRNLLSGNDPTTNSTVRYKIDGSPLQHILLENDTSPIIVLWQQATIYKTSSPAVFNYFTLSYSGGSAGVDLSPPDQNAVIRFDTDYEVLVKKVSDNGATPQTLTAATVHNIAVPAKDIIILELTQPT